MGRAEICFAPWQTLATSATGAISTARLPGARHSLHYVEEDCSRGVGCHRDARFHRSGIQIDSPVEWYQYQVEILVEVLVSDRLRQTRESIWAIGDNLDYWKDVSHARL